MTSIESRFYVTVLWVKLFQDLYNAKLRRTFGPKRDENGEWRRLQNEELHSLYRSPNIVRGLNLED